MTDEHRHTATAADSLDDDLARGPLAGMPALNAQMMGDAGGRPDRPTTTGRCLEASRDVMIFVGTDEQLLNALDETAARGGVKGSIAAAAAEKIRYMTHPTDAGDDLTAAIALIRKVTPATSPWTETDFVDSPGDCTDTDEAIATILNAVIDGRLSPSAAPAPHPDNSAVEALVKAACAEAEKAIRKFPQPNYVISKVAEEAGEVVKAAIHCAEGRETPDAVVSEITQAMAMLIRLYLEGDQVHGLPALASIGGKHD